MNTSINSFYKPDPDLIASLKDVAEAAGSLNIPFMVIGATARDLFFYHLKGVPTTRATADVDVGIRVSSWSDFSALIRILIDKKSYQPDNRNPHRMYRNESIIDILPFGSIEQPTGSVAWPPTFDSVMRTVGFEEAYQSAVVVKISTVPEVMVRVSTPPALVIMKLNAWKDCYPDRKKDAVDFFFFLKTYRQAGNDDRLFSSDDDLLTEGLDPDQESARLLGRDTRLLCTEQTRTIIATILEEEFLPDSSLRLLSDMIDNSYRDQYRAEKAFQLLEQFYKGLIENR